MRAMASAPRSLVQQTQSLDLGAIVGIAPAGAGVPGQQVCNGRVVEQDSRLMLSVRGRKPSKLTHELTSS